MTGLSASGIAFGTSGLRGLAHELCGPPAYHFAQAFARMLVDTNRIAPGATIALGADLRPSSGNIAQWCAGGLYDAGHDCAWLGELPTPALALHCLTRRQAGIMVTGSHIPADRNGLKFYRPDGEISKDDEQAVITCLPETVLADAMPGALPPHDDGARNTYRARYREAFRDSLHGLTVGVYQHSCVARDLMVTMLEDAGATVVAFGRSNDFVAVDTEAVTDDDASRFGHWVGQHRLDALVSSDGDGDRPLMVDEAGQVIAGDVLGVLTAQALGARFLATPVTTNSALDAVLRGVTIVRTRVGSPHVIAAMQASEAAHGPCMGFEANGGVLTASPISIGDQQLSALPTRDSILPILTILAARRRSGLPLSQMVAALGLNAKASGRIADMPRNGADAFLAAVAAPTGPLSDEICAALNELRGSAPDGRLSADGTDGLKLISGNASLHLRPSGNAPELRIYCEAADRETARRMLESWSRIAERFAQRWQDGHGT